ncbi:MAG: hypothetical protein NTV84_10115 [Methanoregula sp.]|nr:hypothetical protein [Methanoregula sp.]
MHQSRAAGIQGQRPERAPRRGAKVTRREEAASPSPTCVAGVSHRALCPCPINSDEHDAKHGVRSVRKQPMATERNGSGATSHGRHRLNSTPRED